MGYLYLFYPFATLARYILSSSLPVCLSVCPSVRHKPVLCWNDWTNRAGFFGTEASFLPPVSHCTIRRFDMYIFKNLLLLCFFCIATAFRWIKIYIILRSPTGDGQYDKSSLMKKYDEFIRARRRGRAGSMCWRRERASRNTSALALGLPDFLRRNKGDFCPSVHPC